MPGEVFHFIGAHCESYVAVINFGKITRYYQCPFTYLPQSNQNLLLFHFLLYLLFDSLGYEGERFESKHKRMGHT